MLKAEKMATINSKFPSEIVFLPEELREVIGYEPLTAAQLAEYEPEDDQADGNPLPGNDPEQDDEDEEA